MKRILLSISVALWSAGLFVSCDAMYEAGVPSAGGDMGYYEPSGEGQAGDKFEEFSDNPFVNTQEQNVSTFSVDADGAAFAIMRGYIDKGRRISPSAVRIEEYLNYFTFNYPAPTDGAVSINAELGDCPWNTEHKLLRLGIRGKDVAAADMPKANYVFLIDVSGSMNGADRLDLLKSSLLELTEHLQPTDRVSIVTYSGSTKLLLESTLVRDIDQIKKAIRKLEASGSTAGASAIQMAYDEATKNYIEGGNNRIIMGTDGDFNVGVTNTDELVKMVEEYAARGIYMTVCGFGQGNLNDAMMEKVSNSGNGTYVFIDDEDEMVKVFINERSRLLAVASDSKCQVTFDSTLIAQYRLIGYENRVMSTEDFEDDTKDAGEIGAGQTITALYEIVPTAAWSENTACGTFDFRYKELLGGASIPLSCPLQEWKGNRSENLNFAAGVAAFGMLLRQSEYKGTSTFRMAYDLVNNNRTFDPFGYREDLLDIIEDAQEIYLQ